MWCQHSSIQKMQRYVLVYMCMNNCNTRHDTLMVYMWYPDGKHAITTYMLHCGPSARTKVAYVVPAFKNLAKIYFKSQIPAHKCWPILDLFRGSSIVCFWITLSCSKKHKYNILRQYWYTRTFSSIHQYWNFKYTFSKNSEDAKVYVVILRGNGQKPTAIAKGG